MKPIISFTLAFGLLLPVAASAQTALDSNGDGVVNLDELQAVFPDISSDIFMTVDLDGDALLDADELAAGRDAGLIPAEQG